MTFDQFIEKYANRKMYEHGGRIDYWISDSIYCSTYRQNIHAHLFDTPSWLGWKDDKQRREFYKDAKSAGVYRFPNTKNRWYKRIY